MIRTFIDSKIYISLAAVFLSLETQVLLGLNPKFHPYLCLIFFATLFQYNLPRLMVKSFSKNRQMAVFMLSFCIMGFLAFIVMAKKEVLLALIPIGALSTFYSMPFIKIREIPYLKIFVIALVWSLATVSLPAVYSGIHNELHLYLLLERFFFIFAITIPFDIRDMAMDKKYGLKTIPMLLNERYSLYLSYFSLLLFFLISMTHNKPWYSWAMVVSTLITFFILASNNLKKHPLYYEGLLDGCMILQGALTCFGSLNQP